MDGQAGAAVAPVPTPPTTADCTDRDQQSRRKDNKRTDVASSNSRTKLNSKNRKNKKGSREEGLGGDEEGAEGEVGISLETAVAVTSANPNAGVAAKVLTMVNHNMSHNMIHNMTVDELLSAEGGRDRGLTDGSVCSTFEINENDSSRGSGYFIQLANSSSPSSSSPSSSCANSTSGTSGSRSSGGLYASQSSTTSDLLPILNLQHLQHYAGNSNTSYLNNHHSHHLPHLPLPLKQPSFSSTTSSPSTSFYGLSGLVNPMASSPPPHMLSFYLSPSGSASPRSSSCSSTTSFLSSSFQVMNGSSALDRQCCSGDSMLSVVDLQTAAASLTSAPNRLKANGSTSATATGSGSGIGIGVVVSQGIVKGVGEVLTLEELKRREMQLSEVLSEEEWLSSEHERLRVRRTREGDSSVADDGRGSKEREKELRKREKEREKELKKMMSKSKGKSKKEQWSSSGKKKAESENDDREDRRERDRTTGGRRRASSTKSRKQEDKDHTTSRFFLTSSSSAVETRRTTPKSQRVNKKDEKAAKSRKKEEKEKEKERERARREREKERERERKERSRENGGHGHRDAHGHGHGHGQGHSHSGGHKTTIAEEQQSGAKQRKRPKYSLAFSFRNKSLSSSSLPKMKNAKKNAKGNTIATATITTIIPKSSPLALMPASATLPIAASESLSSSPAAATTTSTVPPSSTPLGSSSSYSAVSSNSAAAATTSGSGGGGGRRKSLLSSSNSGTKTKRPFIFSYGGLPNGSTASVQSSNSSIYADPSLNADHIVTTDSDSDHETEVEKDTETVTSRFFRRNRGRADDKKKSADRAVSTKKDKKSATAGKQAKKEKTSSKKAVPVENKDHIRQGKEQLTERAGNKSPGRRRRSSSRRIQYSGSEDSESPEEKTECSLTRTKSCRSQLSSSGGSCSSRLAQLLSDSSGNMETDKIDRLAKTEAVNEILKIELARLHEEKQKLEFERLLWESQQRLTTQLITPNKQIKLNIGGEVFFTSIETLRRYPNCTLCLIFTSHYFCSLPAEQQDKGYFLDRDPKHFRLILNFLRTGAMVWPESACDRKELMLECEFYNLLDYVSLLPRREFCRSVAKIFGSPLECDQDYRNITFHFDYSFLFLLTIQFSPYFPDEAPILQVHSLSHCDEESKPIELTFSHFLTTGTSKMDALAERLHAFVLSQLNYIKRSFADKSTGLTSEDEFDSLTSEDSRRPSTEQLSL